MKTINLLIISLLLASSAEAVTIRESQNIAERTIGEALQEAKNHKKHHHHHHTSDSDSEQEATQIDNKKVGDESHQSLMQQTIDVIQQSKGTPEEDAKMRAFIKNMHDKNVERDVPTTLDYRLKQGIKDRPAVDATEATHIEKQAETESTATAASGSITQEQIKPVGGKDQTPTYEEHNKKQLIDAHDNHLDMHGKEPKMPMGLPKTMFDKLDDPLTKQSVMKPVKEKESPKSLVQKKETPVVPATPVATATPVAKVTPAAATTKAPQGKTGLSDTEKNFENTLQEVLALHESSVDLLTADSAFHKLSHLTDPEKDYRTLDKTMAEMAYLDVLDKFDVSMTDDEEKSFYRNHFEPAWKKYSNGTILDYDKTPGFFQELKKRVV